MPFRLVPAAAILALLAACSPVRVKPSGVEGVAERSPDCPLEFLNKAPGRPYDELGELESHVTAPPPGGAREALRPDACRLGADAIIVTKDFVTNEFGHALVAGTAIKYRAEPAPSAEPPSPEPQPEPPGAPTSL